MSLKSAKEIEYHVFDKYTRVVLEEEYFSDGSKVYNVLIERYCHDIELSFSDEVEATSCYITIKKSFNIKVV